MQKPVSGRCPESGQDQTITVTYQRIQLAGGGPSGNKILSYHCPYAQEHGCSQNGADGRRCPLLQLFNR